MTCRSCLTAVVVLFSSTQAMANWTPPTPVIVTTTVEKKEIEEGLKIPGTFKAIEDVTVCAKTEGEVLEIAFEDGDYVKKEDLLFRIDDREKKANHQKAQADVKLYQGQYRRAKELFDRGFLSQADLDKAEALLAQANADLAIAKEELEKTKILAPFDGFLSTRAVSTGAYVRDFDPLVRLQSLTPIRFEFQVPIAKLRLLRDKQPVNITTDAFPHESFSGKIVVIEPRADEKTRNVKIFAELPNENSQLLTGIFGNITIATADKHLSLVIPEEALVVRRNGLYVYKVEHAKANGKDATAETVEKTEKFKPKVKLVKVNVGTRSNNQVEVISGVSQGDQIVLRGQDNIQDNADVEIYKQGK